MPLVIEQIDQPSTEDWQDLAKIYADYPAANPYDIEVWGLQQQQQGRRLLAGRFNGRLLAAGWLTPQSQLTDLCVRALTRRRGVARQLLTLLLQNHTGIYIEAADATAELTPLLQELGFTLADNQWRSPPHD